jgi:hypothetical protein
VIQTTNARSSLNVPLQSWLRPALTAVRANLDYERYRAELEQISAALGRGLIEAKAIAYAIEALPEDSSVATRRKAAGKEIKDTHGLGAANSAERHNNHTRLIHSQRPL